MSDFKKGNIAVIEMKSVARGVMVTDSMAKAARISIVLSTSICPGKYLAIIEGELGALDSAVRIAEKLGGRHIFSSFIIGGINTRVIEAISGKNEDTTLDAMGIIESMQIAHLINSSDIAVDSAEVDFVEFRLGRGCGVNSFYILTGTLSSVNSAVENAAGFLGKKGSLIAKRIVPNPDREVWRWAKSALCRC